jgi:hypothetical protein
VKKGLNFIFAERVETVWKETLIPGVVAHPIARKQDDAENKIDPPTSDRLEQR